MSKIQTAEEFFQETMSYWTSHMIEKNAPCYLPMVIWQMISGKGFNSVLMEMRLSTFINRGIQGLISKMRQDEGDFLGILYFFHLDYMGDLEIGEIKKTLLNMIMFTPQKNGVSMAKYFVVTLFEDEFADDGDVVLQEYKDISNDLRPTNQPDFLKILYKNPFFM